MRSLSDRPLKKVSTEDLAEIFDFCEDMLKNFDWDYYADSMQPDDAAALRLNCLCAAKIYQDLGLADNGANLPLADLSDWSALSLVDGFPDIVVGSDAYEALREDWREAVMDGRFDNFDSSFLIPKVQGFEIFDWPYETGSGVVDAINEAKNQFGQMPEEVYCNLNSLAEGYGVPEDEDCTYCDTRGFFRLTIVKSEQVGKARKKALAVETPEGNLLCRILNSRYLMTNYEVGDGYFDDVDPATDTWWLVLPNVFDWESQDSWFENNDTFQNPMFPLYLYILSELANRVLGKKNN